MQLYCFLGCTAWLGVFDLVPINTKVCIFPRVPSTVVGLKSKTRRCSTPKTFTNGLLILHTVHLSIRKIVCIVPYVIQQLLSETRATCVLEWAKDCVAARLVSNECKQGPLCRAGRTACVGVAVGAVSGRVARVVNGGSIVPLQDDGGGRSCLPSGRRQAAAQYRTPAHLMQHCISCIRTAIQ